MCKCECLFFIIFDPERLTRSLNAESIITSQFLTNQAMGQESIGTVTKINL